MNVCVGVCRLCPDEQQLKREKLAYNIVCQEEGQIAQSSEAFKN